MNFQYERLYEEGLNLPLTLSLFDVFELFVSLLLTCELTVIHLLLLDLYETLFPFFLLGDVNTTTVYFTLCKIVPQYNQD